MVLANGAFCAAPSPTAAPPPSIRRQIDVLLKHRLNPQPLPVDLPNPFEVTGGAIRARPGAIAHTAAPPPAVDPHREAAPPANADVLAACALRLRISGLIRTKDELQMVINDTPRKEGDLITVQWNNAPVYLRILRVLPDRVVLQLMEAELTLRYSAIATVSSSRG